MSYYEEDDNDVDAEYDNDNELDEQSDDDDGMDQPQDLNPTKILGRFQNTSKLVVPDVGDVEDDEEEGDEEGEGDGDEDGEGDGDEEGEGDEDGEGTELASQAGGANASALEIQNRARIGNLSDDDSDDDSDYGEKYLEKMDVALNASTLELCHPECRSLSSAEVEAMVRVVRDASGTIVDPLHQTVPILTKYEKAKVLGQRAVQLNAGAVPFVKVPEHIIDGYEIAKLELEAKRIPFIISRLFPDGSFELWNVNDMENIGY